jgi:hypothetical protein
LLNKAAESDDQSVLATQSRDERLVGIVVYLLDGVDAIGQLGCAVLACNGGENVLAGIDERFGNILPTVATSLSYLLTLNKAQ